MKNSENTSFCRFLIENYLIAWYIILCGKKTYVERVIEIMLKYKTEQFVAKINAPITCKFNGEEILFENGKELADYQFDKRYVIDVITVENGSLDVNWLMVLEEFSLLER